ncbi:MAG: phage portal protein [Desulfosalsimonas sp.]
MARQEIDRLSRFVARTIGVFAPNTAIRYLSRRARLAYYTGASPKGPNKEWNPPNKTEDALLARDRGRLLARARDLERNSSHISGAIGKICNNVVYTGIFPQAQIRDNETGKLKKGLNQTVERRWKEWARVPEINFYDIQELVLRHLWIDGECLVHRFYDKDLAKRGLCPLGLEVLEPDFLDHTLNGTLENGNRVRSGIEFNERGRPVAYHLFKEHPGDSFFGGNYGSSRRVPASEIKHIFHQKRASQHRGVSWLSAIIIEMRDFQEYQSSERIAARLASAFGVFVESPYPEHQVHHPLTQKQDETKTLSDIPEYIESGRIDVLPPGMKINAAQFERPGQNYEPYTKTSLKGASAGSGMSYENFSNDYAESTYSSARQAILEERRGYRKLQMFLNRKFNDWVWDSWLTFAEMFRLLGGIGTDVPVIWQNPGWPWIDPQKDAKGAETELKLKITNRRRLAAERGLNWDDEIEQLEEEEERISKLPSEQQGDNGNAATGTTAG